MVRSTFSRAHRLLCCCVCLCACVCACLYIVSPDLDQVTVPTEPADIVSLKPRALRTHMSHERPHSLADLKTYKDTKILVAKFLEHSSCSLPPEVQQVVNSIKSVIQSDEKHMEEAIFSANVIDQVRRFRGRSRVLMGNSTTVYCGRRIK